VEVELNVGSAPFLNKYLNIILPEGFGESN